MRSVLLGSLIICGLLFDGTSQTSTRLKPLQEITGPDTEEEACQALVSRVVKAKLFPHIRRECFLCELSSGDDYSFRFTLRFDQERCGGDSPSTLIDRFMVLKRSPVILWYDFPEDRYLPFEYAWRYHKTKGTREKSRGKVSKPQGR